MGNADDPITVPADTLVSRLEELRQDLCGSSWFPIDKIEMAIGYVATKHGKRAQVQLAVVLDEVEWMPDPKIAAKELPFEQRLFTGDQIFRLSRKIMQSQNDPGSFTPRGADFQEPISMWQARALEIALTQ